MVKLKIISGSNRPGRFNDQMVTFIAEQMKGVEGIEVEVLDLATINLPFLDEVKPPMMQDYAHDHTKKWAATIAEADGFIMVTPEYNHSYSAVLKNAIDFLSNEWNYKPVGLVSYGAGAGGIRAIEHLRGIAGMLKMYDLREELSLVNYWEHLDAEGKYQFTDRHKEAAGGLIKQLTFWAGVMKEARLKLQA